MSDPTSDKPAQETIESSPVAQILRIPIEQIRPSPHQARKVFDQDKLEGLAKSMEEEGQIEPVMVRKIGDGYELIFGERRLRAAKLAGFTHLEAKVIATVSEAEASAKGLIENLQREGLTPLEEAEGFLELLNLNDSHWNQERIAEVTGKDASYISRSLQFLAFPQDVIEKLRARNFSRSHALELLRLPTPEDQSKVANEIVNKKLSWEKSRSLVDGMVKGKKKAKKSSTDGFHFKVEGDKLIILGQTMLLSGTDAAQHLADAVKESYIAWAETTKASSQDASGGSAT